jgi:glycosyltransferase involved in cell wall biosynthesis
MAGVPGVTTDVGSASEVILDGVTGLVVAPAPAPVAEALLHLLENGIGSRMGMAARRRAELEFGIDRLVADHQALYDRLLSGDLPVDPAQSV